MMELNYTKNGDYLIPDIQLSVQEQKPLGKYGRMRRAFLQENNTLLYNHLILTEKLYPHLWEIQETATARMEQMMAELLKANPAPDKKSNQMAWVQHMNMLKAQAEEVILTEFIKCSSEHYFGAVYDCEENLKSILSICKHHMPRWETNGVFLL